MKLGVGYVTCTKSRGFCARVCLIATISLSLAIRFQTVVSNEHRSHETPTLAAHAPRLYGNLSDGPGTAPLHRQPRDNLDLKTSDEYSSLTTKSADEGSCTMRTVTRYPGSSARQLLDEVFLNDQAHNVPLVERALFCSQIGGSNYVELVKGLYKSKTAHINQLHFESSQSQYVFASIDLICNYFDCSNLSVFNITEQEIHDYKALAAKLASWPNLEVLDLTNTSLESVKSILTGDIKLKSILLANLTHLHLDENKLSELDFNYLVERMPRLRYLTVSNNTIYNIHCNESVRSRLVQQFEVINLAGNVINCDRGQIWLLKLFQHPETSMKFPDQDKINCSSPVYFNDMTWSQRVSVMETKICEGCACRSLKRTAISVDCHNKNLTSLPDVLPLNTKILNLTSNSISSLGVPENSRNWENVTYVYLENNLISSFQPLEANFKFMRNLAALDIRRNRFQEFPSHTLERFINLDQVHLSDNPWLCDCESTFAFQEWLQRQFHKVGDKEEIRCGLSGTARNGIRSNSLQQRLSSRVIYKLSKSELCPQDSLEEPYDWLDVVNILLSVTIVLIVIKVVMDYIYQHRTKGLPHFFRLNI